MAEVPPYTEPMLDPLGRSPSCEWFGGSGLLHSVSGVLIEVESIRLHVLEKAESGLTGVLGFFALGARS